MIKAIVLGDEGLQDNILKRLPVRMKGNITIEPGSVTEISVMVVRVAKRLVFPGYVLFFRIKNSVWLDFLNLAKCPGFLINDCLSLFLINSMFL